MKENILAYMNTALSTELTGYKFYIHASEIIIDEHGKNMFIHLAKDELDHIKAISSIVGSIEETGRLLTYEEALNAYNNSSKGLPIFSEENELIKKLGKLPSDVDAINIAIDAEDAAVHFYSHYLNSAKDTDEKILLTRLVDMERGHLKLLRWEYESLVHTGFWCDFMEFTVEGEKE